MAFALSDQTVSIYNDADQETRAAYSLAPRLQGHSRERGRADCQQRARARAVHGREAGGWRH
jgi:hypothetical protein